MRRAYLDTEFTTLNQHTYKLISLALVVPHGPELYVELSDAWEESDCSDFVLEVVLPQLDLETHGRKTEEARSEMLDFLRELGPVEIICDAPHWDWPLLAWLAGPAGLPETVTQGYITGDIELTYTGPEPPHHALEDARLLADMLEKVPVRASCAGLMLAAGFARRYGSDKRTACLADGTPLLVASLRSAQAVLDEIWLVVRPEDDLQALGSAGYERVVRCDEADRGMGHSLACGAAAISRESEADAIVILLADMPWIRSDTLELLIAQASNECIVLPTHEGQRGHPVIFGRRFWPALLALEGDQGARGIIQANPQALVCLEVNDPGVILDVDTPQALTERPDGLHH